MLIVWLLACVGEAVDSDADCGTASHVMFTGDDCTGDAYVVDGGLDGLTIDIESVLTPIGTCEDDHFVMEGAIPACP